MLTCIVKTTLNFSGDQNGQRQETWHFAPSLGVPVKWSEQTSASESGATFTQNATWTLTSAP